MDKNQRDLLQHAQFRAAGISPQLIKNLSAISGKTDEATIFALLLALTKSKDVSMISPKLLNDFLTTVRLSYSDDIASNRDRLNKIVERDYAEMVERNRMERVAEKARAFKIEHKNKHGKEPTEYESRQAFELFKKDVERVAIPETDKQISLIDKVLMDLAYEFSEEEQKTAKDLEQYELYATKRDAFQARYFFTEKDHAIAVRKRLVEGE